MNVQGSDCAIQRNAVKQCEFQFSAVDLLVATTQVTGGYLERLTVSKEEKAERR